jgi:hypothetical protein
VPVTYDLRFAVSAAQPAPVAPALATDRGTPLLMPLVILPPIARDATETAKETTTVAALPSQPATETAPATIDIPLPEPTTVDLTFSPAPATTQDKATVAAAAASPPVQATTSQAATSQATTSIDIPLPEPAAVDLTFSPSPAPAEPEVEIGPKGEATPSVNPETDARAASAHEHDAEPVTVAVLVEDIPPGTVKLPVSHIPLPKPKAKLIERTAALHPTVARRATLQVAAKVKPRRRMVAKRDDFEDMFNFAGGQK